jgi:hypothetical protein
MKKIIAFLFIGLFLSHVAAQPLLKPADLLSVYAKRTGKTILQPCQLPALPNISPSEFPTNKTDWVVFIQNQFNRVGYEFVPSGEKFVVMLPTRDRTNALFAAQLTRFQPPAPGTNSAVVAGMISMESAKLVQALDVYSSVRGCTLFKAEPLPPVCITLRIQQNLTREEVIYAFNITMLLNGVVPIDKGENNVAIVALGKVPLEIIGSKGP